MPEQPEGSPVGTADMHGGGVTFKDRDGNDVSFEIVRLGTTKELATVKAALENREQQIRILTDEAHGLRDKLDSADQHLADADAAYKAEKENSTALAVERGKLDSELAAEKQGSGQLKIELTTARDELVAAQKLSAELRVDSEQLKATRFERDAAIGEKEALSTSCDNFKRALLEARAELDAVQEQFLQRASTAEGLRTELVAARAEIENLMTAKASLEETSTALEVSQKELGYARTALKQSEAGAVDGNEKIANLEAAFEAEESVSAQLTIERDRHVTERDVSRQALADLKAELLTEGDRFKTILDTLAEKIVGE